MCLLIAHSCSLAVVGQVVVVGFREGGTAALAGAQLLDAHFGKQHMLQAVQPPANPRTPCRISPCHPRSRRTEVRACVLVVVSFCSCLSSRSCRSGCSDTARRCGKTTRPRSGPPQTPKRCAAQHSDH